VITKRKAEMASSRFSDSPEDRWKIVSYCKTKIQGGQGAQTSCRAEAEVSTEETPAKLINGSRRTQPL